MNVFEQQAEARMAIAERAQVFVRLVAAAIDDLKSADCEVEIRPSFITGYHGFYAEVFPFETSDWIDNPNYNPNLTNEEYSLPENLAVDAGFHKIEQVKKMCRICVIESQDTWEPMGDPEEWTIENIPQELFLTGTESEIIEFFKERHKADVDRENENAFISRWSSLYHYYSPEELEEAAKAMKAVSEILPHGKKFTSFLELMRNVKRPQEQENDSE